MKLVVWNIQNFTLKRLKDTKSGNTALEKEAVAEGNLANLMYVLSTVQKADADVFVVLETLSQAGNLGTLAQGNGAQGLIYLLSMLRENNSPQWYLVPPLRVNPTHNSVVDGKPRTETVGVFWRNDRVQFLGPNVWPQAYPSPWDAGIPANTTAAAQCQFFYTGTNTEIQFPKAKNRRPYLTTFSERSTGRVIKLFSVHTSPGVTAQQTISNLLNIPANIRVPGNNEVTVFAGDFNVNLLAPNILQDDTIRSLANAGLNILPFPNQQWQRSFLRPRDEARTMVVDGKSYFENLALDYGFVQYGAGAVPANNAYGQMIMDRVAGVTPGGALPNISGDMLQSLSSIQNIDDLRANIIPNGAVRSNGLTTLTTATPHGLHPGYDFSVIAYDLNMHLTGLDPSFEGQYWVASVPSSTSLTYWQPSLPNKTSGAGSVRFGYRNYVFRQLWNYWHIGPPIAGTGAGTSDHLPLFMLI